MAALDEVDKEFLNDYPGDDCVDGWGSMWHDWGDCRIEANAEVLARYRGEMGCGLYQHG